MADSKTNEVRSVLADMEQDQGFFIIGKRYHIRTPTYQYLGKLVGVTGSVFVFEDTSTVYETGPYPQFYKGSGTDIQKHEGAGRMIVDRAGTVLHEINF